MDNQLNHAPVSRQIPSSEIDQWVFQKKVELLYNNQTQSWVLSMLASTLVAYLALDAGYYFEGIAWWLVFSMMTFVRTYNTWQFCHSSGDGEVLDYANWLRRFYFFTFFVGCIWGIGGIVIGSFLDPLSQVFIFIILLGVSAAAIPLLGVVQGVMLTFQIPTTIPYLIYLAVQLDDKGVILVFMFGLYLIGVIVALKRMDQNLSESLSLQYEKSQLANSLTASNQELLSANEKLETLSRKDELTGLHNRRFFEIKLDAEWKRETRDKKILSLLVIDIDYFKLYNDTYGHAEGDDCLRRVAQILKTALHRSTDVIARIGGEEFVALLPDVDTQGAFNVALQMQTSLKEAELRHATSPIGDCVSVSIGVASVVPGNHYTALGLFKAADKALYKSKTRGRNQVQVGEIDL